jgi:7,8-dihydroneopterin aldolase/epimerase/oxygenase
MTVCLDQWICRAYHGVFAEEQQTGNEFCLSVQARYQVPGRIGSIQDTISYTDLLSIARKLMEKPEALLETVVINIADEIKSTFPQVTHIHISLYKTQAPVSNFQGRMGVIYEQNYIAP